uniref:7TM_GPCR_Srx domain-containing protein n=1 Tax=Brugia timori TaxID=42155 RepID=A0A0R3R2A8_9BILA
MNLLKILRSMAFYFSFFKYFSYFGEFTIQFMLFSIWSTFSCFPSIICFHSELIRRFRHSFFRFHILFIVFVILEIPTFHWTSSISHIHFIISFVIAFSRSFIHTTRIAFSITFCFHRHSFFLFRWCIILNQFHYFSTFTSSFVVPR